jgi:hypothetical protein
MLAGQGACGTINRCIPFQAVPRSQLSFAW